MAMATCRECGKEVSTEAAVCPHCGVKNPVKRKSNTKGLLTLVFVILVGIGILGGEDEPQKAEPAAAAPAEQGTVAKKPASPAFTDAQLDAALAAVTSEPKVISAAWNSRSIPSLLAGVWDDGTKRNGYAEYLCMVLADHGVKGAVVRVMDNASKDWRELGKVNCPR